MKNEKKVFFRDCDVKYDVKNGDEIKNIAGQILIYKSKKMPLVNKILVRNRNYVQAPFSDSF